MSHPDDRWVEVTGFSDDGSSEFLISTDGVEQEISKAKAEFVAGHIDVDELERRVAAALAHRLISPVAALGYYQSMVPS